MKMPIEINKLDYIKILTYCNLYLYSYFLFSLPSKFLTKPLRVLENEVNKRNKSKQTNKEPLLTRIMQPPENH